MQKFNYALRAVLELKGFRFTHLFDTITYELQLCNNWKNIVSVAFQTINVLNKNCKYIPDLSYYTDISR